MYNIYTVLRMKSDLICIIFRAADGYRFNKPEISVEKRIFSDEISHRIVDETNNLPVKSITICVHV
jgi:hypothetical protein